MMSPDDPYATTTLPMTAAMSAYLVYMFRHFQTTFSVRHPLELAMQRRLGGGDYFRHPIDENAPYGSRMCPFGRQSILVLVGFLWFRYWSRCDRTWSIAALGITATLSLMNMNAMLYLVPYFAYEGAVLRPTRRSSAA